MRDFYCLTILLADPGEAMDCLSLIHSFSQSVCEPFPPTALRRRHAQTVRDSPFSYKIDYMRKTSQSAPEYSLSL